MWIHFFFKVVSIREIEKKLRELNSNNETKFGNIPTENLKQSSKNCSDILEKLFHDAMSNCHFPDKQECVDLTPIFKKDGPTKAKNYRVFYQESQIFLKD